MKERRITRNVIQIISRYKGLSADEIKTLFKDERIYAGKAAWAKFIDVVLLSIGIAFLVAGTIFFFAYNWDELHKFVKLGIVQFLILAGIAAVFLTKPNLLVKNIILTGTSMMVGLLFSVFGQIYQTGADAYDFFLGWTVFILLWAVIAAFEPLWLLLLLLINITFSLYVSQTGPDLTATTVYLILFLTNLAVLGLLKVLSSKKYIVPVSEWFFKIITTAAVCCITISLIAGIFDQYKPQFLVSLAIAIGAFTFGIKYGIRHKSLFLLCIIPLSIIVVFAAFMLEVFNASAVFLLIALAIIASITFLVKQLISLNEIWYGQD